MDSLATDQEVQIKFVEDEGQKVYTGIYRNKFIAPGFTPKFLSKARIEFELAPVPTDRSLVRIYIKDIRAILDDEK